MTQTDQAETEGLRESEPGHWATREGWEMAERYARMTREQLGHADLTDFELANRQYMAGRNDLDLVAWQTAAKERIRWLSVQLALAHPRQASQQGEGRENSFSGKGEAATVRPWPNGVAAYSHGETLCLVPASSPVPAGVDREGIAGIIREKVYASCKWTEHDLRGVNEAADAILSLLSAAEPSKDNGKVPCSKCGNPDLMMCDCSLVGSAPALETTAQNGNVGSSPEAACAPQFTPGPWFVHDTIDGPLANTDVRDRRNLWVARCDQQFGRPHVARAEAEANARLIAAAPELYDALARLLTFFSPPGESSLERFERIAEEFYRETGILAPGKSEPLEIARPDEERRERYDQWVAARVATARALVAAHRDRAGDEPAPKPTTCTPESGGRMTRRGAHRDRARGKPLMKPSTCTPNYPLDTSK